MYMELYIGGKWQKQVYIRGQQQEKKSRVWYPKDLDKIWGWQPKHLCEGLTAKHM